MEELPLGRIATLVPEFAVKNPPFGRTLTMVRPHRNLIRRAGTDGSMPSSGSAGPGFVVENFILKILNLGARRDGDLQLLIARLQIKVLH